MRNWEFTNYTCKEMYVSHIAFIIKWLSQSAHSQNESSQNGLQPSGHFSNIDKMSNIDEIKNQI